RRPGERRELLRLRNRETALVLIATAIPYATAIVVLVVAIIETAATNGQVVGQAGLMIFDTRGWTPSTSANAGIHGQPELGWALIRAHWGHGYATEAAAAIREWAHECRSIERLVSLISSDNVRSQRVAERLRAIPTETVTPAHSGRKTVV